MARRRCLCAGTDKVPARLDDRIRCSGDRVIPRVADGAVVDRVFTSPVNSGVASVNATGPSSCGLVDADGVSAREGNAHGPRREVLAPADEVVGQRVKMQAERGAASVRRIRLPPGRRE